jgi:glyoxylase-like metal-dependent hydrolase (beta-lactamase superfamily II)
MAAPIQIPLPLGMSYPTVNAWLFTAPEPVLVDCGLNTPGSRAALGDALAQWGLGFGDLAKLIVTHTHVDHAGLAGEFAALGVPVWVSGVAAPWLLDLIPRRARHMDFLLGLLREWGFAEGEVEAVGNYYAGITPLYAPIPPAGVRVFPVDGEIEMGGLAWRVVYAPGHSNRQVCFYQPGTRQLIGGDMLLPKAPSPEIEQALEGAARQRGLPQLLESYAHFRALDAAVTYPGHGEVITDHRALIDRQVARIGKRKRKLRTLIERGEGRIPALLQKMYRYMPVRARFGGLPMLIGYVDVLEGEGAVRWEGGEVRRG